MSYQEDPMTLVDTDGIKHSFDRGIQALNSSESRPKVAVGFLASGTHESTSPQQEGGGEVLPASVASRAERTRHEAGPKGFPGSTPSPGKTCLSPFSSFFNRTPQSNTPGVSSPVAQVPVVPVIPQLPLACSYVTSFDLMALDQLTEARGKAKLEIPVAPILGECYLLPGQRKLPVPTDELDPSSVVCSQMVCSKFYSQVCSTVAI